MTIVLFVAPFSALNAQAAELKRVLIIPFKINAQQDYAFLRDGIFDMLATRLSIPDKTVLVDKALIYNEIQNVPQPLTPQNALELGQKFKADYVLFGSLTLFGSQISTDARMFDTLQGKTILAFDKTGEKPGDVIAHIDQFADQVKADVFGEKPTVTRKAPPAAPDGRQHPDDLIKPDGTVTAPAIAPQAGTVTGTAMQRSRRFKAQIRGLTSGDIDGDGGNELIFVSKNTLYVFRYAENLFQKVREIEGSRNHRYLSIDAADINNNGRVEIFVTAVLSDNSQLSSFVLEWDGKKFVPLSEGDNWYYRVIKMPGRGDILFGQKRSITGPFSSGIYEMVWKADAYTAQTQMSIPEKTNLYSFSYGNAFNDGRNVWVVFSPYEKIKVIDESGQEEWQSSDKYGASGIFLDYRSDLENPVIQGHKETTRFYLPNRLIIEDIDNDGKNELLVARNKEATRGLLERLRVYEKGQMELLAWDGIGMHPKWKSRELSGYITDYTVADLDNDGLPEIALSVVAKTGTGLTNPKSYLIVIDYHQPSS